MKLQKMEPVTAQSVKEVEDAQAVNTNCIDKLTKAKEILDIIEDLHKKITDCGKDSAIYSPLKFDEIKELYNKLLKILIKENKN
jgi:hypothetical protein